MRGSGASTGTQIPFSPKLAEDAKEVIEWTASRKWSNGKVEMMGRSYLGWIQLMAAAKMPEAILSEGYSEGLKPGGIDALAWIDNYSRPLNNLNLSRFDPDNFSLPAAPVIDEDGDGELADEVPLTDKGDPATFLDDGEPVYSEAPCFTDNFMLSKALSGNRLREAK